MVPQMAASVLCSSMCVMFLFVFPVFLFLKHDQFYQGLTAENSPEHTTKYFTGFGLFGCFAGHCIWQSRSSGQKLQDEQIGEASPCAREV